MSRIGKMPVPFPTGTQVSLRDGALDFAGPKGTMSIALHSRIQVVIDPQSQSIRVQRASNAKQDKALHGLFRSLIANAVRGVTEGYESRLDIIGIGYNAKLNGRTLLLNLGLSHEVAVPLPEGLLMEVPRPTHMVVRGCDKQLVGQFAANLRRIRPPNPYTLKGIKYQQEVIKKKAGKTFVSGSS